MARTIEFSMRWWWGPLSTRPTSWILYSGSSLEQQSTDRHVAPLGHIILIPSHPVCSFSLLLRALWRSRHDVAKKIAVLALNNNHVLNHSLCIVHIKTVFCGDFDLQFQTIIYDLNIRRIIKLFTFFLICKECLDWYFITEFRVSDWVRDCCLMPTQQFSSYIMARTIEFSMRWWWGPLCTRPTSWILYSGSSLEQQSTDIHVAPLGHIILIPS
jgi:hypothetical protein